MPSLGSGSSKRRVALYGIRAELADLADAGEDVVSIEVDPEFGTSGLIGA